MCKNIWILEIFLLSLQTKENKLQINKKMNKEEVEKLCKEHSDNETMIRSLKFRNRQIEKELMKISEHPMGEIVQYTIKGKQKWDSWERKYIKVSDRKCRAVITDIKVYFNDKSQPNFDYSFNKLKKDGTISHLRDYCITLNYDVDLDVEWTGEIHPDYQ